MKKTVTPIELLDIEKELIEELLSLKIKTIEILISNNVKDLLTMGLSTRDINKIDATLKTRGLLIKGNEVKEVITETKYNIKDIIDKTEVNIPNPNLTEEVIKEIEKETTLAGIEKYNYSNDGLKEAIDRQKEKLSKETLKKKEEGRPLELTDYEHTMKIPIRMKSGYKHYRSGDDYLLTKREIKSIPKMKYKILPHNNA